MTDRELLECAAKAAGIVLHWHEPTKSAWVDGPQTWNPLTDDGDAFRLAVTLELSIIPDRTSKSMKVFSGTAPIWAEESRKDDPLAATRRAIVLAAAEIGRAER